MPDYVGSRDWLDTLNRLWHIDHAGPLPPAREDPAPTERARTSVAPMAFGQDTRTYVLAAAQLPTYRPAGGARAQ